jgi:hypothetical protein
MQPKNFSYDPKIRYLDRTNTQKKLFLNFFSLISWRLCTSTKGEKVVLFGLSTGTKSPRNQRKKLKKSFFRYLYGPNTLFLDLKIF